jgi:hypothetical protein
MIAAGSRSHKGHRDSRAVPAPLIFSGELGLFTKPSIRMTFFMSLSTLFVYRNPAKADF